MNNPAEAMNDYLQKLGLEPDIAAIYQALQAYGPQTISEVARTSGVERVRVYRLLEDLKASGIIAFEVRYKRTILHAAPVQTLQGLLAKREQELVQLQQGYEALVKQFDTQSMQHEATRVQFYEGMQGIKQMLWNETYGTSENLSILYDNMQHKTDSAFFERWVRKCNENNYQFRGIIGDHFIHTQQQWYGDHTNERLKNWKARYISDEKFHMTHSLVIYDDVVMHRNWNNEQVFGIEIHDMMIAQMQRQFFEMLWHQAIPIDDLTGLPTK